MLWKAFRMTPRLLPWVTEWTPFTKNGDTDTSLEKSYIWGVLHLTCLESAKRRCFARSWIQEAKVQRERVQDWRCRLGRSINQNESEKSFTLMRL